MCRRLENCITHWLVPCLWTVKPTSYKLRSRGHSSTFSQICKMVLDDLVKVISWIIKINLVPNKLLSKPLKWALFWIVICYHTRKYYLPMWLYIFYLNIFLNNFLINIIHSILSQYFNEVVNYIHLFLEKSQDRKPDLFIWLQMWKNVVVCQESRI